MTTAKPFHEFHIGYSFPSGESIIVLKCYNRKVTEAGLSPDGLCFPTVLTFGSYAKAFPYYRKRLNQLYYGTPVGDIDFAYEFNEPLV